MQPAGRLSSAASPSWRATCLLKQRHVLAQAQAPPQPAARQLPPPPPTLPPFL